MTENGRHKQMHPVEQIIGFRGMAEEGKTPAQIGDLLGYGARHVQRMLKLAGLAPAILDALAKDDITTEQCQALALENDPDRQLQVYEAACKNSWNGKADVTDIRALITASEVSTNSDKFLFVGEGAFSPDAIRTDLFSDEQGGYVDALALDAALLERLETIAEGLREAEGWAWCAGRMEPVSHYGEDSAVYLIQDEPAAVYTDDEQRRIDELQEQYDEYNTGCDETDAMNAEMAAIECATKDRAWTAEQKASGGVVVSWQRGGVRIQRGVMLREKDENGEDEKQQTNASAGMVKQEINPADEISLPLLTKMSSERTLAVQAALMQQPEKALALLAWRICRDVFGSGAYGNTAKISINCRHYALTQNAPSGESGAAYVALMQEKDRLAALLPQGWKQDFTTFFGFDGADLLALLAFCASCSIDGEQTREFNRTSRSPLDALETALGFHMRDWWQPTKDNFFTHLKKPQIVAALNDAGLTGAAKDAEKMKKGDAAELAESFIANTRWVPVWMRADVKDTKPEIDSEIDSDNDTAQAA